jgi:fructose-1,6-bisphosphatase/sedoheptulose 1,7-bisphosphatase-like protein
MRRELAIEFSRVTEAAALAGYKWLGRGDKNIADGAAVAARVSRQLLKMKMRKAKDLMQMTVVATT